MLSQGGGYRQFGFPYDDATPFHLHSTSMGIIVRLYRCRIEKLFILSSEM